MEDIEGGLILAPRNDHQVAVPETLLRERVAAGWLLAQRRAHTEAAYRRDITAFFTWCDECKIDALRAHRVHLDGYRRHLETEHRYSPATVSRKLSSVSSFYRYATVEVEHLVPRNPMARVVRPEGNDRSDTPSLDLAELQRLIAVADDTGAWEAALVRVLFYSAVRVSELCTATTADLRTDQGERTLAVIRKGGRRDRVVIPSPAAQALDRHLAGRTGPLFLTKGVAIDRHQVSYRLRKLARAAGVTVVTPHGLRHTSATLALLAGQDIREVQRMLGHKRIETTLRYDRSLHDVTHSPALVLALVVEGDAS